MNETILNLQDSNKKIFALIDCNNFYASCERIFNPKLAGKPVVILSNNDGCVIARSNEAKAIGIPMGAPVYKYRDLIEKHNVYVFSSNFTLYGDISNRVMTILSGNSPDMEIYSIDEAFLNFSKIKREDLVEYSRSIVAEVAKSVGIPISIGIAPTKTLAKLANKIAKKNYEKTLGAYQIESKNFDNVLANISVGDIWGIGWRNTVKLNNIGIYTALDFKNAERVLIKKLLGVMGERTYLEMHGISCIEMESPEPRKGILSSRSFGKNVDKIEDLREAVSVFATRACEKLREQGSVAGIIYVGLRTNKHRMDQAQYMNFAMESITPTDYTPEIIKAALTILDRIYKPGFLYKKASVMLSGIMPKEGYTQEGLFGQLDVDPRKSKLMETMDSVNREWGREVLKVASTGVNQTWRGKKNSITNRFTTDWEELLEIKI